MSAMPPLQLDFRREPGMTRAGTVMLVAGAFAAAACAAWYLDVAGETELVEARTAEMSRMMRRTPATVGPEPRDSRELQLEIGSANAVIRKMTIPWEDLFGELESSAGDGIALLAVQPDASSRVVRISGEARNFSAMVEYARRLEGSAVLENVLLLAHEVKVQDQQRPVTFSMSANWSARR